MADAVQGNAGAGAPHGHDAEHAAHPPHLQHHFDTPVQQFDAGKLGMWLFLATEVLFFSGLFCAYAVYRSTHPEIFRVGHIFLNPVWGAVNTVVLIMSSFTMALGVWCAQTSRRIGLIICLSLTLIGAFAFMGVKGIEYTEKWQHGLLWGQNYNPTQHEIDVKIYGGHGGAAHDDGTHAMDAGGDSAEFADATAGGHGDAASHGDATSHGDAAAHAGEHGDATAESLQAQAVATLYDQVKQPSPYEALKKAGVQFEETAVPEPNVADPSLALLPGDKAQAKHEEHVREYETAKNVHLFFGIYFAMTGLHGIHVLAGIGVIGWLLIGAIKGRYTSEYYTPVDLVGLYWHLVDLVWIFLFPMLYLIH